jgi:hypothetical protein
MDSNDDAERTISVHSQETNFTSGSSPSENDTPPVTKQNGSDRKKNDLFFFENKSNFSQ